jgi:glycosyltransferase involved in cell wall biosynthesis
MQTKLSVIICTHNPRYDYLKKVLQALQQQSLPTDLVVRRDMYEKRG